MMIKNFIFILEILKNKNYDFIVYKMDIQNRYGDNYVTKIFGFKNEQRTDMVLKLIRCY